MMPEPVPPSLPLVALMVTTLGVAFTAAAVMAFTSSLLFTMTGPAWLLLPDPVDVMAGSSSNCVAPATTPPPTRPAARMLATRVGTPKAALRFGAWAGLDAYGDPGWLPP